MAEWSKFLVSGARHFDGMCSNPTSVMLHYYKLQVLLSWKQFENNKQHSFNCIGRMAKWSKSHSCHATLLKIKSFDCQKTIENYKQHTLNCITVLTILAGWPSGLRRCFQVPVISMAWVRIPLLSCHIITS